MGENGSGEITLVKFLTGDLPPIQIAVGVHTEDSSLHTASCRSTCNDTTSEGDMVLEY